MKQQQNFQAVAAAALNASKQLLPQWFPAGRWEGPEFLIGNLRGDAGDSLRINANSGKWADFADPDNLRGGDLVSLYAAMHGIKQGQAASELAQLLGVDVAAAPAPKGDGKRTAATWEPIVPAPEDAPAFSLVHHHYGRPEATWTYRDAAGRLIGHVCRFKSKSRGKEILPAAFARSSTGETAWRWLSFPKPRPLYRLDALAQDPKATVLLVEGEKTAEAAQRLFPASVAMTWPGGAKAVGKANWQRLVGRRVIVWPDADEPGLAAASELLRLLTPIAESVKVVRLPDKVTEGWDLADAELDGWTPERAQQHARENLRTPERAETERALSVFQTAGGKEAWRDELIWDRGFLKDCQENVLLLLEHHPDWRGVLWWDEFGTRVVNRRPPPIWGGKSGEWTEVMDSELKLWMTQKCGLMVRSIENIRMGIRQCANRHTFHPVQDYLNGLQWDGRPRVDRFFADYMDVPPSEYARLVSIFFLLGLVARAYEPGCTMRLVPILEGEQFKGKSTALQILGGEWFSDTPFTVGDKDAYVALRGCWLYEIAEYDAFSRAEALRVKAFVSSRNDSFRAPYDRQNSTWPRQCVFAATTNQDEYFKDPTGNTRFAPVRTGQLINLEGIEKDRAQLLAEAVVRFQKKERRYATKDEQDRLFTPEQDLREVEDPWFGMIAAWANSRTRSGATRVTQLEILRDCLEIEASKIDGGRQMSTRVGIAMHRAGWKKHRETLKGSGRGYYYTPPQAETGETTSAPESSKQEDGRVPF